MTTPHRTLLQQALDALETICDPANGSRPRENPFHAMEALRAYLAAPPAAPDHLRDVAEKVAPDGWMMVPREPTPEMRKAAADAWLDCDSKLILNKAAAAIRAAIAASPAQPAVPLTEGRITGIANELAFGGGHCNVYELARAIERAHGITGGSNG